MKFKIIGSIIILVILAIALSVVSHGNNNAADNQDPDAVSQQQQ